MPGLAAQFRTCCGGSSSGGSSSSGRSSSGATASGPGLLLRMWPAGPMDTSGRQLKQTSAPAAGAPVSLLRKFSITRHTLARGLPA